jgi:hypothetical protein
VERPRLIDRKEYDMNKMLGFAVSSDDGTTWSEPTMLEGTFGHYIWRAATLGGKAYLCGRRKPGFDITAWASAATTSPSCSKAMTASSGRIAPTSGDGGDETAFSLRETTAACSPSDRNGRRQGSAPAALQAALTPTGIAARSTVPSAAAARRKWGEHVLVGGRHTTKENGAKTSLCWLIGDQLHEFAELPSGGDNSYPGFVELSPTKGLISWYSSHEKDEAGKTITAIYMAGLSLAR